MTSAAFVSLALVGLAVAGLAKCTSGDAPAYSGPCTFSADAFDLSCTTDTDCIGVAAGYYCSPAQCGCTLIGISRSALGAFNAEVAETPLGSGAVEGVDCGCPAEGPICCQSGTCQSGFAACTLPVDSGTE